MNEIPKCSCGKELITIRKGMYIQYGNFCNVCIKRKEPTRYDKPIRFEELGKCSDCGNEATEYVELDYIIKGMFCADCAKERDRIWQIDFLNREILKEFLKGVSQSYRRK